MSEIKCNPSLATSDDRPEIQVVQENTSGFGDAERFGESQHTEDYERQNAEEINLNGVKVLYVAIQTDVHKDKITGEDSQPYAIELYNNNIRMKTDSNQLPSATNQDTSYGMVGWVDTMVYHVSKLDFNEKTTTVNLTNDTLYKTNWTPKSGDIIVVDLPPYYPTLEVIDVDDDFFHHLNVRPNWILTLQSYTKKLIDFTYIKNKYPTEWSIVKDMINPVDDTKVNDDGTLSSNNIITSNDYLEDDERNMNSSNKNSGDTLFDDIFGN